MSDLHDRTQKLASSFPEGDAVRVALEGVLTRQAVNKSLWNTLVNQIRFPGWELSSEDAWGRGKGSAHRGRALHALWEKEFTIGQHPGQRPFTSEYGVGLTVSLRESEDGSFDAEPLVSWTGPGVFGGRPRYMYSDKFPAAISGEGRHWDVSPALIRGIKTSFKKVVKHIDAFVAEDIEEFSHKTPDRW